MKIKRDLLIILILFFIGICFGHIQSFAAYHSSDGVTCPGQMAVEMDYDVVKNWTCESGDEGKFSSASAWASDGLIYGVPNCVCMHGNAITGDNAGGYAQVELVLDIDESGDCTISYLKNKTVKSATLTLNSTGKKYAKCLAYLSYAFKNDPDGKFNYIEKAVKGVNQNQDAYHFIKNPESKCYNEFQRVWNTFIDNSDLTDIAGNYKYTGGYTTKSDNYLSKAKKYARGEITGKAYVGKIFIMSNPEGQGRAIIFGKEVNGGNVSITKYISKVDNGKSFANRSNYTGTQKQNNPVKVAPGNTITFTLELTNTGSSKVAVEDLDLTDSFDKNTFELSSTTDWKGESGKYKYTGSASIPKKGSKKITIEFKVKTDAEIDSSTKYKNTASITYGDKTKSSADYVKINPTITIDKYITNIKEPSGSADTFVNGNISGRDSQTKKWKQKNAVNCAPGATITYTVKITSNMKTTINITDSWVYGLNYSSSTASETKEKSSEKLTFDVKASTSSGKKYTGSVTLTFKLDENIVSGNSYHNKVYLTCDSDVSNDEYVRSEFHVSGDINKYISKIITNKSYEKGFSRSSYTTDEKKNNAVRVVSGDIVEFKIVLTNTGDVRTNYKIYDRYEEELFVFDKNKNNQDSKYKWVTYSVNDETTYDGYIIHKIDGSEETNGYELSSGKKKTFYFYADIQSVLDASKSRYKNIVYIKYIDENNDEVASENSYDYVKYQGDISITKYITNVDYPEGENGNHSVEVLGRSTMATAYKQDNPVNTIPGAEVTYKIRVRSNVVNEITLTDRHYTSQYSYSGSGFESSVDGSKTILTKEVSGLKDDYGVVVTLKLTVGDLASSELLYNNTAEVIYENKTYSDHDYTTCTYEKTIKSSESSTMDLLYSKYINEYNDTSTSDRSAYSELDAYNNPLTVENGDRITYRIYIENDGESIIDTVEIEDKMQNGLKYLETTTGELEFEGTLDDFNIYTYTFDTPLNPGESTYIDVITEINKSDMYLYSLSNSIEITGGTWEMITITVSDMEYEDANGEKRNFELSEEITTYEPLDENYIHDNGGIDYVQLDDVEIAGKVWLDNDEDGLIGETETAFTEVNVFLYKNGTKYAETVPNDKGKYSFGKVDKGDTIYSRYPEVTRKYADTSGYNSYIIVFEYNGVLYEPTEYVDESCVTDSGYIDPYKDWNSRSHANENESDRIAFNDSFETVAYDKAYSGTSSSSNKKTLSYTKDGHISTIDWDASTTMEASSFDLYLNYGDDEGTGTSKVDYVDYLKHMNLGLVERGQADLSASKDLVEVYTTVNGSETTYIYNDSSEGKLEEYYRSDPYVLKIYNEDYSYRTSNYDSTILGILGYTNENADQNDLQVRLTYKIMLSNDSVKEYYGVIREVIDIYSDSLELDRVYDSTGEWNQPHNTSSYNEDSYNYDGYTTCFITGSSLETVLAPGDTKEFYIDYSLKKNNGSIILDEERNIAQIGAFSIYDNENKTTPSGVVDGDANPGNVVIYGSLDDYESYEDNIYSTSIDISLRGDQGEEPPGGEPEPEEDPPPTPDPKQDPGDEYRVISGNVWEDLIITNETDEGELVGNGKKDIDEDWAENITVYLYESITGNDGNEYLVYSGISTSTDSDGNYYLYDKDKLHAGNYKVRFIYGNDNDTLYSDDGGDTIKFSGQDYKSTLYTDVRSDVDEDQPIYGSEFEDYYKNNGEIIYSEAKDNELRRLEVINYSTTMTYELDKILKDKSNNDLVENTYMFADTRTFIVTIEDYNNYSNPENFIYTNTAIFKDSYMENKIGNINFGLITRPQTKLVGTKDISRITAITSDGNPLVDLNFDIYYFTDDEGDFSHVTQLNEEESQGYKNVQILDRSRKSTSNQGFRYINIDSILMQGMTIIVEYQIGIGNTSDIDLENKNLIKIVENYDLGNVVNSFKDYLGELVSMGHTYGENASETNGALVFSSISNINLNNVMGEFVDGSEYPDNYKLGNSYYSGYFLGDTYYTGFKGDNEDYVYTRIDQIIDYVDTDLVLDLSENTNEKGEGKFINYTADQIYSYRLLEDINEETSNEEITDGVSSYIVEDSEGTVIKNNLAFNVESEEVNPTLYKFLPPLSTVDEGTRTLATYIDVDELNSSNTTEKPVTYEDKDGNEQQVNAYNYDDLYVITLNASRTLSSEQDADGLSIDNVSEIIKVTNTAGRKVYVLNQGTNNDVGHIGNSFKDVRKMYSDEEDDEDITIKTVVGETDTDYTEFITFSPPTGLGLEKENEHRIVETIFGITLTLCVVVGGLTVIIYKSTRKKFYR